MGKFDLSQIRRSPKSTIVGLCVLALAAERGVHFDEAGHLSMTAKNWFEVGCGVLTAVVSALSQDAGSCAPGELSKEPPQSASTAVEKQD